MTKKYVSILESMNSGLSPETTKDVFSKLVDYFDSMNKTTGRELIIFLQEEGEMLATMPIDINDSRRVFNLLFYVNQLDELALYSEEVSDTIDERFAANRKLLLIVPPKFQDGKFVMIHNVKLTQKQNEIIDKLITFGFNSIEMILPYE